MNAQDYWLIEERFVQLMAEDRLDEINLRVVTGGAEGEQVHYDKTGGVVKGEGRVDFVALKREIARLERLAGHEVSEPAAKTAVSGVSALNQLAALLGQKGLES